MRNAIVVMSCVFLVLLFIHVLIEYGINFADEASTLVSLGKDLFGFALAVTVLFYFLLGRDKARPAA